PRGFGERFVARGAVGGRCRERRPRRGGVVVLPGERPQRRELLRLGAARAARDDERLVVRDRVRPVSRLRGALRRGHDKLRQLSARLRGRDGLDEIRGLHRIGGGLRALACVGCGGRARAYREHNRGYRTFWYKPHASIVARRTLVTARRERSGTPAFAPRAAW